MALAGLVVGTGGSVAGHLRGFVGRAAAAAHAVVLALLETLAASLICHFCLMSAHMDTVLAAGIVLVKCAVYH